MTPNVSRLLNEICERAVDVCEQTAGNDTATAASASVILVLAEAAVDGDSYWIQAFAELAKEALKERQSRR